jgi:RAD54-like protein 2
MFLFAPACKDQNIKKFELHLFLFQIWNHPDVLYYFLKKRNCGEDVDLDLEEATAASTTPLVSGVAASPRGGPAKRGRGRGSRNPTGQSKRDRKVQNIKYDFLS